MARKNIKRKARKLLSKHVRRKWQKTKPMKIAALIVSAIQDLRETKGSTSKKIIAYIRSSSNLPEKRVKRQVKAALRRGVEYGILRRYRGHYFLPIGNEVDRANRIAVRFARLPSPRRPSAKSRNVGLRKTPATRDRKKGRGRSANRSGNSVAEGKSPRKSRSLPFSTATTATSFVGIQEADDISVE
ncbi:uncharacterized protein LOC118445278 [Vespa mandarinia]|uniref:uncharacterized protein LOC118445278 n=1 Tax=Vespa mandarinia TaxID=7446 RepID=UPI00161C6647|nr:uncharacterized protein LOC118445278 [Vespa mandarinia]